jgi:hypothetical protein
LKKGTFTIEDYKSIYGKDVFPMKRVYRVIAALCIPSAFLAVMFCQSKNEILQSEGRSDLLVVSQKDSVTLSWEKESDNSKYSNEVVKGYNIYYRQHGTNTWVLYDSLEAGNSCVVKKDKIGKGYFDFAVCSIGESGSVSNLHSSLDSTADPSTGWFLNWK